MRVVKVESITTGIIILGDIDLKDYTFNFEIQIRSAKCKN